MTYDCRCAGARMKRDRCSVCPLEERYGVCRGTRDHSAEYFRVSVMIVDPQTGERIPNVFWCDTSGVLKRFIVDAEGRPMVGPSGTGRLEVKECRAWKAVTLDGKQVIAQSESTA
jgi:hypothetical protein